MRTSSVLVSKVSIFTIIEIIGLKEKDKNISYIAFLDGSYSNILLGDAIGGDKLMTQRKEIKESLTPNSNSFWVNTRGFESLISDLNQI